MVIGPAAETVSGRMRPSGPSSGSGLARGGHCDVTLSRLLDGQRDQLVLSPLGQRIRLRPSPRTQLAVHSSRVAMAISSSIHRRPR